MLTAFILWTSAICFIDVKAIGPNNSSVGFATVNAFVHRLTGVHMSLYHITDWLGLIPIFVAMGFFFPVLLKLMERIPPKVTKIAATILGAIMAVDIIASCIVALI
jgi:undecaprenyl-diphosphatase